MTSSPAAFFNELSQATKPAGNTPSPTYFPKRSMKSKQVVSVHLVRCCNLRRSRKNSSGLIASAVSFVLAGGTLQVELAGGTLTFFDLAYKIKFKLYYRTVKNNKQKRTVGMCTFGSVQGAGTLAGTLVFAHA
jgi:hypothetical protein